MDVGFGEAGDRRTDGSPWSRTRSTKRSGLGTDMGEASVEYDLYGCMCVYTYIQTCCVPKWPSEFIFVSTRPPYLLRVVGPRLKGLLLRVGDFVSERLPSATRRSCRDLDLVSKRALKSGCRRSISKQSHHAWPRQLEQRSLKPPNTGGVSYISKSPVRGGPISKRVVKTFNKKKKQDREREREMTTSPGNDQGETEDTAMLAQERLGAF